MENESLSDSSLGKRNYILFTIAVFGSFAIFGISDNMRGTALPRIQAEFLLSEMHIGLLLAASSVGYLAACSFTAALGKIIGIKTCHITGLVVVAAAGSLICFSTGFAMLVLGFFVLNIGFGMIEIAAGVLAAKIFVKNTGTMMSLAHFFYGAGATMSPIISTSLMAVRLGDQLSGWRFVYLFVLSFALVPVIPTIIGRMMKKERSKSDAGYAQLLRRPELWLLVLILSLTLVCEYGIASWFVIFLETSYSFSSESAALYLTLYFLCFTLGRLILGPVIDKIGFINTLIIVSALSGSMVITAVLVGEAGSPLVVLAGAVIAPVFPTVMAVIAKLFSDRIEQAMTAILTTIGIIIVPANFLVGWIINQTRHVFTSAYGEAGVSMAYSVGFLFLGSCCLGALVFALILRKGQKRVGRLV